jgi:membrane-associated phospholipid phosphatase
MAIVFNFSPLPVRFIDGSLWFVFFLRIILAGFIFGVAHFFWQIHTKAIDPISHLLAKSLVFSIRVWLFFYIALIIHCNLKMNVGIWRDTLHDPSLHAWDQLYFQPLLEFIDRWHGYIDRWVDISAWYGLLFEFSFLFSFVLLMFKGQTVFRLVFCATIVTLLLGTVGYLLYPSVGPFLYHASPSELIGSRQSIMLNNYQLYIHSGGLGYTNSLLTRGLAAMPSLHVANTVVFLWFIYKYIKPGLVIYIPFTLYICIEALYTRWHYVLDVIVGILLAAISILLTYIIYAYRNRALLRPR